MRWNIFAHVEVLSARELPTTCTTSYQNCWNIWKFLVWSQHNKFSIPQNFQMVIHLSSARVRLTSGLYKDRSHYKLPGVYDFMLRSSVPKVMTWDSLTHADERRKIIWKFWGTRYGKCFVWRSKILSFKSTIFMLLLWNEE